MNFSDLKTEFAARGFDYFDDTRRGLFINSARSELDMTELWPYREKSAQGDSPLIVSDLGAIEAVMDVTMQFTELLPVEYGTLVRNANITDTGPPVSYYVAEPGGVPTVVTYPESSNVIGVQYWSVPADLVATTDVPAAPARYHKTIADIAVRDAYRDADNHQAAESMQVQIDRDLHRMRIDLMTQQVQGPDLQSLLFCSEDW